MRDWGAKVVSNRVVEERSQSVVGPNEAVQHPNMIWIPGGTFRMGSDNHYPEEKPVHRVTVDGFFVDRTPVTNRQFKDFVRAAIMTAACSLFWKRIYGGISIGREASRPNRKGVPCGGVAFILSG